MWKWILGGIAGVGVVGYLGYAYLEKQRVDLYAQAKKDAPDVIAKALGKTVDDVKNMTPEMIDVELKKADEAAKAAGSPVLPSDAVAAAKSAAGQFGVSLPAGLPTGGTAGTGWRR